MTKEEVIKLMLKDVDPKDVHEFICKDGTVIYEIGKPDIKRLAKFLVELHK